MYNLKDVQQNLQTIIKQLASMESAVVEPQKKKQSNSKTMLLQLPKGVLLIHLCSFLTMQQINNLSSSCSGMRRSIYSPLGLKFLSRIKTPYQVQIINKQSNFKIKMKNVLDQSIGHSFIDQHSDQKFIANQRISYKNILLNKYNCYLKSRQRYQAYRQKVKTEQGLLFKMKQQILYLDGVRKDLDEKNKINKDKLKYLADGFEQKISKIDIINNQLIKERNKLQNQKQALANKIRQYQHQIQIIKNDSEKSKQILRKLKNYLLYKEL